MSTERLRLQKVKGKKAYHFFTHSNDEVYIGDPAETAQFKPQFLLKRWLDESYIKLPIGAIAKQLRFNEENNYVVWEGDWFTIKVYPVDKKERKVKIGDTEHVFIQNELGGLEFEAILKEKPLTNSFSFRIETKGLKFYYQPPLTEELNPDEYDEVTETYAIKDGEVVVFRPPEVVGSYAVYHATKGNMHRSKEDAEKYRVGKAFHIYRPKLIDAEGKTAWADLNIDEKKGVLTITLPQEFLDRAVYPVTIDPTFGYETAGASSTTFQSDNTRASWFTCPESGTAQSITVYCTRGWTSTSQKCAIYKKSDGSKIAETTETEVGTTAEWYTFNFASPPDIENIDYWLLIGWDANSIVWLKLYWDSETGKGAYQSIQYPTLPDPFEPTYRDRKFSIYCTYTAEGGAQEITVTDSISLSDSVLRHKTLTINDSIGASDSILGHKTFKISDAISSSDSVLGHKQFSLSDIIQIAERILRNKTLSLADQINTTEQVLLNKSFSVSDAIQLLDEILRDKVLSISDSLVLSDTALSHKTFSLSDAVQLAEQILRHKSFKIDDNISLADTINVIKEILKTVMDSIQLSDSALAHKTLSIQDAVQIAEGILRDKHFAVLDSISLSDLVNVIKEIIKTVFDNVSLSDSVFRHKVFAVLDNISLLEEILRHKRLLIQDSVTLTENVLRNKILEIQDQISSLESVITSKLFIIADQISLTDTIQIVQIIKIIHDTLKLTEKILAHKELVIQDQIKLLDVITIIGLITKILKLILIEFLPIKISSQCFKPVAITSEALSLVNISTEEVVE